MMKAMCSLLILFHVLWVQAQTNWIDLAKTAWTEDEIKQANTAVNNKSLTTEEKDLVLLMNLCRLDGEKFWNTLAKPYLDAKGESNQYTVSLEADLKKVKNAPLLALSPELFQAASFHALDMGRTGKTGHNSSDGTAFSNRIKKYYKKSTAMAENCSYGYNNAMDILMQLLVDEGVPSLGHRKNIVNPAYRFVGVSIQSHKTYRWNCVMDFAQ